MFYLDTSVVVALFAAEVHTARVLDWMAHKPDGPIAVSLWVETELAAALAAKIRLGEMSAEGRDVAEEGYRALRRESLRSIDILPSHFANAARMARTASASLRGGDALHLAIADMAGATLCTLDHRQAEAGEALEIPTLLII